MVKIILCILKFIIVSLLVISLISCSKSTEDTSEQTEEATPKPVESVTVKASPTINGISREQEQIEESVRLLLESANKHLMGEYNATYFDSDISDYFIFEVWQKDGKIRIDDYKDGKLFRTLMTDGNDADLYIYSTNTKVSSVLPASYYMIIFNQKFKDAEITKQSDENILFTIAVDKFCKIDNEQKGYYILDITYESNQGGNIKQTVRGNYSNGNKPAGVNTAVYEFFVIETDRDMSDEPFIPPFMN